MSVLTLKLLVVAVAAVSIIRPHATGTPFASYLVSEYDDSENVTGVNASNGPHCTFGLVPCSITILGNLQLVVFYGIILAAAAKLISDGAELLLDLGLPASIIGGVVLPLLGAVPDSAMIVASGLGDRESADQQIAVGMGTLAGSTIMLLTIPWFGALLLGRVDIVNKQGRDNKLSKFRLNSFINTGISVTPDVTFSAVIMLITAVPYLIIQSADWFYGPARNMTLPTGNATIDDLTPNVRPAYIKYTALVTSIICFIFFIAYLVFQVFYSVQSRRKESQRHEEAVKRMVIKRMILNFASPSTLSIPSRRQSETTPLLTEDTCQDTDPAKEAGLQRKYFRAWRVSKKQLGDDIPEEESGEEPAAPAAEEKKPHSDDKEDEAEEPKWKITLKSIAFLTIGVGLVTVYSDPMVDALTSLTEEKNSKYYYQDYQNGVLSKPVYGQHIPIPVFYLSFIITPICSNASELVSSLIFAAKKTKVTSSMTFSQLYGAATMNNTLCLGIFCALVAFKDLTWQYSAEVTVILLAQIVMGIVAILSGVLYKHTYILLLAFPVFFLYFFSIFFIWLLEFAAHWK